jgi:pyridoxal phosphate enzyme (YggS family)
MDIVNNFIQVRNKIKSISSVAKLIVVSKNQNFEHILKIISNGQLDFGENKVQETLKKWPEILQNNPNIKLHFIGNLQSNKAKEAFQIFDYIHSLDNEKLAKIFSNLEKNSNKKINYFIQVNIGEEIQKSGITISSVNDFVKFCINDLKLNILGLMCLPPADKDPELFFKKLKVMTDDNKLKEISMGMSDDYLKAIDCGSTYLRIGSAIFNK